MAASAPGCSSMEACCAPTRFRERGGLGVGHEDIYVIHNGQLIPPPEPVRRSLPSIALRVLDANGRAAVLGDLLRIYAHAQREDAGFRVGHDSGPRDPRVGRGVRPGEDARALRTGLRGGAGAVALVRQPAWLDLRP